MTARIIDGKIIAADLRARVADEVARVRREHQLTPGLAVVLVGNEIGLGVIPLGSETRAFVDALGRLNQDVARVCRRVTLMAAGLPLTLKDTPCASS